MTPEFTSFLRSSFEEYLVVLKGELEPSDELLKYDFSYVEQRRWRMLDGWMIQHELQELTNRINSWRHMLIRWSAWNSVMSSKKEPKAHELQLEFVRPLMHCSLIMPSAIRDMLVFVGTNAMHQLRLNLDSTYLDFLQGDPSAECPSPRPLSRRLKEERLRKIAKPLKQSDKYIESISKIDDKVYREKTSDYRNLHSHAIGPSISRGHTRLVTRQVGLADKLERQPDGTYRRVTVPGKYVASYAFGGTEPLNPESAHVVTLEQYRAARLCYQNLVSLIAVLCEELPLMEVQENIKGKCQL
jgi:hypothetical protein